MHGSLISDTSTVPYHDTAYTGYEGLNLQAFSSLWNYLIRGGGGGEWRYQRARWRVDRGDELPDAGPKLTFSLYLYHFFKSNVR